MGHFRPLCGRRGARAHTPWVGVARLRLVRILSLAAVEVGALVGAGFASGREVHEFFARHGEGGRAGIVLFVVLIAVLGGLFLEAAQRGGTRSYHELTTRLAGRRVADLADPVVALALFLGLAVTMAGAGALFRALGWGSPVVGVAVSAALTAGVAWRGRRGVMAVNMAIVPGLVLLIALVAGVPELGAPASWQLDVHTLAGAAGRSSVLYFLYNGLLAVVLFASLGGEARRSADGWASAAIAAAVLGLLACGVYEALARHPAAAGAELPLLVLAGRHGRALAFAYALALAGALLTTAIGNAFGLLARVGRGRPSAPAVGAIVGAAGALALVGFSPLVRYGYRLVAVAGAAYLAALALGALLRFGRGGAEPW
jgi:uncharacterized membrane protein YkvI